MPRAPKFTLFITGFSSPGKEAAFRWVSENLRCVETSYGALYDVGTPLNAISAFAVSCRHGVAGPLRFLNPSTDLKLSLHNLGHGSYGLPPGADSRRAVSLVRRHVENVRSINSSITSSVQWRSIKSAPKDRLILLAEPNVERGSGWIVTIGRWIDIPWKAQFIDYLQKHSADPSTPFPAARCPGWKSCYPGIMESHDNHGNIYNYAEDRWFYSMKPKLWAEIPEPELRT